MPTSPYPYLFINKVLNLLSCARYHNSQSLLSLFLSLEPTKKLSQIWAFVWFGSSHTGKFPSFVVVAFGFSYINFFEDPWLFWKYFAILYLFWTILFCLDQVGSFLATCRWVFIYLFIFVSLIPFSASKSEYNTFSVLLETEFRIEGRERNLCWDGTFGMFWNKDLGFTCSFGNWI